MPAVLGAILSIRVVFAVLGMVFSASGCPGNGNTQQKAAYEQESQLGELQDREGAFLCSGRQVGGGGCTSPPTSQRVHFCS